MQHAHRHAGSTAPENSQASPSKASTLYVVALTAAIALMVSLVLWAAVTNP
jgi:hypothetical protein